MSKAASFFVFLSLTFGLTACTHVPLKDDASSRDPASAERCRAPASKIFNDTIASRLKPDNVRLIFFDARPTTIAFFTFGWQRDLESTGQDRAFYIQFDRRCEVLNMGGGNAAMEIVRQAQ